MSVTVDREPLAADELGLSTVGQVLSHLQKANRLVTQLLIDGEAPDVSDPRSFRGAPLSDHTVFIETTDPRDLANEILVEVSRQLGDADRIKAEAADYLQRGQHTKGLERLAGCFGTWQNAQQSVLGTAQLLRLDLERVEVNGRPMLDLLNAFAEQLRGLKSALENRDFVTLSDLLVYETTETTRDWTAAIETLQAAIG